VQQPSGPSYFAGGCLELVSLRKRGIRTDDSAPPQNSSSRLFCACFVATCSFSQWHCVPLFMADSQHVAKSHHTPPTLGSDSVSHQYQAIAWNRQKRVYDLVLAAGVTLYLTLFMFCSGRWSHSFSDFFYRSQRVSLSLCYGENLDHSRGWIRSFPASPHR